MKVVLAGEGAIARQHAAAINGIEGVEIACLVGGEAGETERFAAEHGIPHWSLDLDECLARRDIDAVVLATPTPLHADQAMRALRAGKHTLVEIPMADNITDAAALVRMAQASGRVAMACHTRRFNPSHQWIHAQVAAGELQIQHLVASTLFMRRENRNALGQARSWTDHLLWHHACHTVDLFAHQTGEVPAVAWALQGPPHPRLGIAMDMSVGLANPSGAICTLALSFNHDGPFGTTFRYIGDRGTYVAHYDELLDGNGAPVDLSCVGPSRDGVELQDREFFSAIEQNRRPEASMAACLSAMTTLDRLAASLTTRADPGGAHVKS
jgi:2-hydroxy-4-carboxymuconate semialdehyde hemiacetal dehydrogenase